MIRNFEVLYLNMNYLKYQGIYDMFKRSKLVKRWLFEIRALKCKARVSCVPLTMIFTNVMYVYFDSRTFCFYHVHLFIKGDIYALSIHLKNGTSSFLSQKPEIPICYFSSCFRRPNAKNEVNHELSPSSQKSSILYT